jgi:hypothetical protein
MQGINETNITVETDYEINCSGFEEDLTGKTFYFLPIP